MSHDFAKGKKGKKPAAKNKKKQPEKNGLPGWLLFVSGAVFGLFAQFLFQLATLQPTDNIDQTNPQSGSSTNITFEDTQEPAEPEKPDLTFYEELPEMEVQVPTETVTPRSEETYNKILQAGAFNTHDSADQHRARILLLGLEATIEHEDGSSKYRVMVGPFSSRSELQNAKSQLINNGIDTLIITRSE